MPSFLTETTVEILKLGLTGLCFLLALLGFMLLAREQQQQRIRERMLDSIRTFTWTNLVIATLVGAFTLLTPYLDPHSEAKSKLEEAKKHIKQLEAELASKGEVKNSEKEALYRLTADRLESAFSATSGKGRFITDEAELQDINYKRLRRAVFMTMYALNADQAILERTFDILEKRGYAEVREHRERCLKEFAAIRKEKLRWLQDVALPEMEKVASATRQSKSQNAPVATVRLPRTVWILNTDSGGDASVSIGLIEHDNLKSELDLIKRVL
jgi:hypothetical protein